MRRLPRPAKADTMAGMMTRRPAFSALALALALPASPAAAQADAAEAATRCEEAVADTVRRMRGERAKEIQFTAGKRQLQQATDEETSVRGEGRYRGAGGPSMPFSYSCAYNAKTGSTSGVVFRDTGSAVAAAPREWQPDLTNVSPAACESAAAAALKELHPRVGRIVFGSDSRRLQPGPGGQVQLEGRGAVERAQGMNAVPFSYRCRVDPRTGRVLGVETDD